MKNKKKKKDNNKDKDNAIKKYTMTSNHKFSINISRILDELGKTSKNTFNHYMFCHKFYLLYKDLVFEEVFFDVLKKRNLKNPILMNLLKKHLINIINFITMTLKYIVLIITSFIIILKVLI